MNTKAYNEGTMDERSGQHSTIRFRCSRIAFHFFVFLGLLLNISGCGDSFQPFQENDKYSFSIFGYLDASADTQWIRITPVRQEFNTSAVVPDMKVTLENIQDGETVTLDDSLFVPDSAFILLNFWTTMDIEPSETYRLKAGNTDGAESRVIVTIPEEFPTPRVQAGGGIRIDSTYAIYIDEIIGKIADVQTRWYIRLKSSGEEKMFSFSYSNKIEWVPIFGGVYSVVVKPDQELDQIMKEHNLSSEGELEILHRQFYVASGGPEWNEEIASMDDQTYALPDGFSNVEEGLGYVVGIYSKVVPYKTCRNDRGDLIACSEEEPFW